MDDYNPADHNVDEVKAYVEENPQEAKAVLEAEQARGDDARTTLVKHLESVVEGQQEAPVDAEAKAVSVEPSPTPTQSDVKTHTVFDKEYEVTPDQGYRVKR